LLPLDCKMGLDDNALYRQKALADIADQTQIDPKEAEAQATTSITSRSTAISVAWSTAPVWRWRPWI
jgi:succinyl-CoA synthetase beta subunit